MAGPNLHAAAGIGNTNPTADCGGCICNNDCSVSLAWNWYGMTKLHLYAALRTKKNTLMSWVGHRLSHTWIPFPSRNHKQPQWNNNNAASSGGRSKHAYGVELTWGTTYKGTMLLPSVIAVYSTRDQTLRKRHKGHKQKRLCWVAFKRQHRCLS